MDRLRLKHDADLCRLVNVAHPIVSQIRHRTHPIGASMLLSIHEISGLKIDELPTLLQVQPICAFPQLESGEGKTHSSQKTTLETILSGRRGR